MATIGYMGPYSGPSLAPGEGAWIDFGEAEGFGNAALAVTASPHRGTGGDTHVLKVDNVNVTLIQTNKGDISFDSYYAGCSVINNGKTTITEWSVLVGVIGP